MVFSRVGRWMMVASFCSAAIGIVGCTPSPSSEVSGTIKLRGQAPKVQGLQIVFTASDGRMYSAGIEPDGAYKAEKLPAGEAKVAFAYLPPELSNKGKSRLKKVGGSGEMEKEKGPKTKDPVPTKLRDPATSGITYTIKSGSGNVFDYDIK